MAGPPYVNDTLRIEYIASADINISALVGVGVGVAGVCVGVGVGVCVIVGVCEGVGGGVGVVSFNSRTVKILMIHRYLIKN